MKNWGFITVMEHQRCGLIGGYLVLNSLGRPIEFHCTTPVRTNRAQEILYGTTLDAFLYGEQIAQVLISRAKTKPFAVLTDKPPILAAQEFFELPICYLHHENPASESQREVFGTETNDSADPTGAMAALASVPGLSAFRWTEQNVGRYPLAVPELAVCPASETADEWKIVSFAIDFLEPFERIRLAIAEAQKAA